MEGRGANTSPSILWGYAFSVANGVEARHQPCRLSVSSAADQGGNPAKNEDQSILSGNGRNAGDIAHSTRFSQGHEIAENCPLLL